MKHRISVILRILFTIAGIGYIAWSIDWVDRVELRPGAELPGGRVVEKVTLMKVVGGSVDPARQREPLTLIDASGAAGPREIVVPPGRFADSEHFLLRPSFITTLRRANHKLLLLGLLLVAPIYPVQAYRWFLLLRARGIDTTYGKALKQALNPAGSL